MAELARELLLVNLEDEMRQSYLDYAMSVIIGRALPDVRDGLKPVHRRVLYAMRELGNDYNKPYKKSARVVGDVIGKYHPHGDAAVYDTIVRLAQDFAMRYPLVDGQGNFGSIDGDPAAAMRYTEIRMARLAHELLSDLDKNTVDFVPNYDETETEPAVLPTQVPNLLANGSSGIAVGMATNIPPHNLREVIDATLALIQDETRTIEDLLEYVPGPDFPTGALINGADGILEAYKTGRGRIYLRAKTHIEELDGGSRQAIIVDELPYQVNKARLLEKIAELVKDKRVEGIRTDGLRDESDKDGMRIVIELRRGEVAEVVLNNLFSLTQLENVFGINMVALVDSKPRLLDLKEILEAFISHRREVVTRRTLFDLAKARDRAHILEGLTVALASIDEMIALIKASPTPADAREAMLARRWPPGAVAGLLQRAGAEASRPDDLDASIGLHDDEYQLSERQAQAILDLRLHRLTGLEQEKLVKEFEELLEQIAELLAILSDPDRLMAVIREELEDIRDRFGDERKTEILAEHLRLSLEDLITEEDVVVTLSHGGYAKAQPLTTYQAQRRGGKGKSATAVKEEDFVEHLWVANTHDTLLCFSTRGRVYWMKVYELPQAGRGSRGKPIVNLLPLEPNERVTAVLPVRDFPDDQFVVFATRDGQIKKTPLSAYSRPRTSGIIAISLMPDDYLIDVALTDGERDVLLFTSDGKAVRFHEEDVRSMGRNARGVRGIRLRPGAAVVSMLVANDGDVLMATENGYGKKTSLDDYPLHRRGGQGVISIRTDERNGACVGAVEVSDDDEVMLISDGGTLVRTRAAEISRLGRATQGVTLIRLAEEEKLVGVQRIEALDDEVEQRESGESGESGEGGNDPVV